MAIAFTPSLPLARRLSGLTKGQWMAAGAALLALAGGGVLIAQVAGDRGIAPVASSTDIEVRNVKVNVTGDDSEDARLKGWAEAQRIAWKQIGGPDIPDSRLSSLVSAVVIESEQLGPRRYIASLGVIFDRARAGAILGAANNRARSAPMLTLPVLISGGTQTLFEVRNPWQRAWAERQLGASAIDYVRPSGAGWESLMLTYGQTGRRSRLWWTDILDQFGAADVLIPIAELRYLWPGGPVEGQFTARYGPDSRYLGEFRLRANSPDQIPQMLDQAVTRFDRIFAGALASGQLTPDPTLAMDNVELRPEIRALIDAGRRAQLAEMAAAAAAAAEMPLVETGTVPAPAATTDSAQPAQTFVVQVATADSAAFDAALANLRGASGVRSVATGSLAIGGTSVLRVTYAGDLAALAEVLKSRGWQVTQGTNALAVSR